MINIDLEAAQSEIQAIIVQRLKNYMPGRVNYYFKELKKLDHETCAMFIWCNVADGLFPHERVPFDLEVETLNYSGNEYVKIKVSLLKNGEIVFTREMYLRKPVKGRW